MHWLSLLIILLVVKPHVTALVLPEERLSREPQGSIAAQETEFHLAGGTYGCPQSIRRINNCRGFTLEATDILGKMDLHRFCNINSPKPDPIFERRSEKVVSQRVTQNENIIRKEVLTTFKKNNEEITTKSEDILIADSEDAFLWERSFNGRGISCLYVK